MFLQVSHQEIAAVALETIFYQSDCFYNQVQENPNPMNRMGTENYIVSDFDDQVADMTFNKKPTNFKINRKQSYIKNVKDILVPTEKRDAMVEYYLSKYKLNKEGGIEKVIQSKSIKADGKYKIHRSKRRL